MSQDTLNIIFFVTIVGIVAHATLQHRKLDTATNVIGYMLTRPEEVWESAKDVAQKMGLIDEPDA